MIRPSTPTGQSRLALAIYTLLWVVLIGREAIVDPANTCACAGRGDPGLFQWALAWWPHAITSGVNPFSTSVIWHPVDINLAATTSVPALSLVTWPITETVGPLVSLNLLTLLSGVLSAWFAYRLCRYVTGAWLPSLVGGYVYGFSSYELGQMIVHLHLIPVFLVPAAVHLVLLRMDRAIDERRFVFRLAGLFALQVLISTEILFAGLVFGFIALGLGFWLAPDRREAIKGTVRLVLLAGGAAALVLSPFLFEAVRGLANHTSVDWSTNAKVLSADPLNYVIPTEITWIGGGAFKSLSNKFNSPNGGLAGNLAEAGAYVGLPLLALTGWFLARTWNRASSRVATAALAVIFVASLGAYLHVADAPSLPHYDYSRTIPLPWIVVSHVPVFDHLLPVRFAMFISLIVGVVVAQALARPGRGAAVRWAVAGVGVLALVPTFNGPYWNGSAAASPLFEHGAYKRYIQRDEIVLVFPVLWGDGMQWQAESDYYFQMASGYISGEVPPAFWRDPVVHNMLSPIGRGPIPRRRLPEALRDFLERHQVGAVIVDRTTAGWWEGLVDRLHFQKREFGGVVLYRTGL